MLHFDCDYMRGAHPKVMEALLQTNMTQTVGYGLDEYSVRAKDKIRVACGTPDADVDFFVGGTQTNSTVIHALLRPYEGVVCASSGHINVHEAGAIECGGHKVLALPGENGKLDAGAVDKYISDFYSDPTYLHMVAPGMVYISHPTEYGTLYSRAELEALSAVCRKHNVYLYVDGARLGYGLAAYDTDVTLSVISGCCDVFYIGGTKVGALFGETVVSRKGTFGNMFSVMKQHGALLAKGRLLGVQFDALFSDNLYLDISRHAIDMAMKLKQGFSDRGYSFYMDSPTNQQFIVLSEDKKAELEQVATFEVWGKTSGNDDIARFVTDWSTEESDVDEFLKHL